jgi:hypothetical protein
VGRGAGCGRLRERLSIRPSGLRQRRQVQRHQRGIAGRELDIASRLVARGLLNDRRIEPPAARIGVAPRLVVGSQRREQADRVGLRMRLDQLQTDGRSGCHRAGRQRHHDGAEHQ